MKLYYAVPSSSSRRLLIHLALKNVKCDGERVDLLEPGSVERHAARNPIGQVPVVEVDTADGKTFITQSVAISEYLEEQHPDPPLLGSDALERARVRSVVGLVASGIQPLHNIKTLQRVQAIGGDDAPKDWMQHFVARGLGGLESIATQTEGPYMLGNRITLADVYVAAQLHFVRVRDVLDLGEYPALRRVEVACLEHKAFSDPPLP